MKRVNSTHNYHDADIVSMEWLKEDELSITLRLDSRFNSGIDSALLFFTGVRNRHEICAAIERSRTDPATLKCIEGFFIEDGQYHLGHLVISCRSIMEI